MKPQFALIGLMLLMATAYAADEPAGYATASQMSSLQKIVDDIDRRTDAMSYAMATQENMDKRLAELENRTASKADMQALKSDFQKFAQDTNFKLMTAKMELGALFIGLAMALFIFQKFWEFAQGLFNALFHPIMSIQAQSAMQRDALQKKRIKELEAETQRLRSYKTPGFFQAIRLLLGGKPKVKEADNGV